MTTDNNREIIRRNLPWAVLMGVVIHLMGGNEWEVGAVFVMYLAFAWYNGD